MGEAIPVSGIIIIDTRKYRVAGTAVEVRPSAKEIGPNAVSVDLTVGKKKVKLG
jgi:hypothetical protein